VRTTDEALLTVQEMIDRYDAMTPEEQRTIEALYRGERPVHAPEPTVPSPDNAADKARKEPTHAYCSDCHRLTPISEMYGPIHGYHYDCKPGVVIHPHYTCGNCAER
jgi:hypothetical protein